MIFKFSKNSKKLSYILTDKLIYTIVYKKPLCTTLMYHSRKEKKVVRFSGGSKDIGDDHAADFTVDFVVTFLGVRIKLLMVLSC